MLNSLLGLRWKLVVSYVVVTLATVLVLEGLVIIGANWLGAHGFGAWWTSRAALRMANELADELTGPMAAGSEARVSEVLAGATRLELLFVTSADADLPSDPEFWRETRVVVGPEGRVVASDPPESYPVGALFAEPVFPEGERLVGEALRTRSTASHFERGEGLFAAAVPIFGDDGGHLGAVYYRRPVTDLGGNPLAGLGSSMLTTTALLLPLMIPLGLIFGFVTATGFTRRLRRLTDASGALEGGDLSSRVDDRSRDEIGRLARQFNAMAVQIETDTDKLRDLADSNARLAEQAQRAAAIEERHRLARELHDGVKQHLFGLNLATSAALNLMADDPDSARAKLEEAGEFSRRAQAEMQALLNELRPAGLDDRGLMAALEESVVGFGRGEGVEVEWQADDDLALPPTDEQALYRVAQEALTNVARHASASRVSVRLHQHGNALVLEVTDNGRGFDPAVAHAGTNMGLQGMRERLAVIGGVLEVESVLGEGTRITARVTRAAREASDG